MPGSFPFQGFGAKRSANNENDDYSLIVLLRDPSEKAYSIAILIPYIHTYSAKCNFNLKIEN